MSEKRVFSRLLALVLCLALLCPLTAYAEDAGSYAVIDPDALQRMVDEYAEAKGYNKDSIRLGYCYLDTGDTWYYNGDVWSFGVGVYYVPMMMLLAEWESSGKMTRDSMIQGYTLGEAERLVLVENDNTVKNQLLGVIGSQRGMLEKIRAYSPLPESYYDPDYLDYCYMTPHFLTDVLKTLYYENERFPNILDCMKQRGPDDRFSGAMDGKYEVAQQFGWFEEGTGPVNNCMGIICTPHPFALVIVTKNQGIYGEVMRDLSILFKDYTLTLDGDYENWSGVAADAAEPAEEQTEPETAAVAQPGEQRKPGEAALDPDDLQKLVENYAEAKGCDKKNISIGYCYLDTGDTWYYNGDVWSFGAGVYYVPMMMLLAERESAGILTRDSKIQGYPLGEAERLVLVENNNAVKNQLMGAIGTVREMRGMIRAYSSLPEEYYDPDFLDYGYMSAHFLTDVMKTLYYENERFPNILECMKERGGDDCFHGALGEDWDVAQQFGLYEEYRGNEYGSCVGVIYTPHPFVLVVMTRNLPDPLAPMGDLAILFSDYTLSLG